MTTYVTAFAGQFARDRLDGRNWTAVDLPSRQIAEQLRLEDPWIGPQAAGRGVFTLLAPEDPGLVHLAGGDLGEFALKPDHPGARALLETRLFAALRAQKIPLDLASRFVAVRDQQLADGLLAVDGVQLRLEILGGAALRLWIHPLRRIVDPRPLPEALRNYRGRSCDVWLPREARSIHASGFKNTQSGVALTLPRRTRLILPHEGAVLISAETAPAFDPPAAIESVRRWLAADSVTSVGFSFSSHPLSSEDLGWAESACDLEGIQALDSQGRALPLGEHHRSALGGRTAWRAPGPPSTFHLAGYADESQATELATLLNQKAQNWPGAGLQFSIDPVPGSLPLFLSDKAHGDRPGLHIDPGTRLITQPNSPQAQGQIAALFLECVQAAGGAPWRLAGDTLRPALGVAQGVLYGRQSHLSFALVGADGVLRGGFCAPFRPQDLGSGDLARALRTRLGDLFEEGADIHLAEDTDLPAAFWREFAPDSGVFRIARKVGPWLVDGATYGWAPPGRLVGTDARAIACLDHAPHLRFLGVERIAGTRSAMDVLSHCLALEHAWAPGRVERKLGPTTIEWARGLLFQRERYQPFFARP